MQEIESIIARARLSDADIAEQHRAFNELVKRFQDMAYGCAYAVLGNLELAQDAVQEAFITAYQKLENLRTPQAFPGWLRRIVLTQCNRLTRRKAVPTVPLEEVLDIMSPAKNPADALMAEEAAEQILATIRKLPENQRRVIQLFYLEEYSRKEIAETLKVPVTTVNNWLYASRQRLKEILNPDLIREGMFEMVRDKLQESKMVNAEKLFNAIEVGDIDGVKDLLNRNPMLVNVRYNRGTQWEDEPIVDETPLHAAADAGEKDIAELLLANGAQIDAKRSDGNTPLHLAVSVSSLPVVECFIRNGADVQARNDWQGTPLHLTAHQKNTDIVMLLIRNGADVHAQDKWGRMPLEVAAQHARKRYQAALDSLVTKLKEDYYVLAAVLYGSLARGDAWEKSDIDITIIQRDGLKRENQYYWLVEDGINISASVVSRSRFKRIMEGALQGSFHHSVRSQSKLLFTKDESIKAWFEETDHIGDRDQEFQLLRAGANVPPNLHKAEKWFYARNDLNYSFLWLLYAVNELARVEVILNGKAPGREVIHQALKYNPSFFKAVYTDLINGQKDKQAIQQALDMTNAYLEERAERLFKPVLDYLAEADGVRTATELNAYFRKKVQMGELFWVYEWLAEKGIIEKVAAQTRLTKKSQVALEEPAYYYDADIPDWDF